MSRVWYGKSMSRIRYILNWLLLQVRLLKGLLLEKLMLRLNPPKEESETLSPTLKEIEQKIKQNKRNPGMVWCHLVLTGNHTESLCGKRPFNVISYRARLTWLMYAFGGGEVNDFYNLTTLVPLLCPDCMDKACEDNDFKNAMKAWKKGLK